MHARQVLRIKFGKVWTSKCYRTTAHQTTMTDDEDRQPVAILRVTRVT